MSGRSDHSDFMVTSVSSSRRYICSTYMQGMKLEEASMYSLWSASSIKNKHFRNTYVHYMCTMISWFIHLYLIGRFLSDRKIYLSDFLRHTNGTQLMNSLYSENHNGLETSRQFIQMSQSCLCNQSGCALISVIYVATRHLR